MGLHHVPRLKNWPVMWKGFTLAPFNFFPRNPEITIRNPS